MRTQQTLPVVLSRQLTEWRRPLDADPDVDEAITRMLSAIDCHLQRQQKRSETKA
jgi:hypothetical protein